jgi:hypothetical protein
MKKTEKHKKRSLRGQGLCCDLLPLLFSDYVDCDAVNGNHNVQSSVYRSNCKYLIKQQKQERMACLGNYAWNRRKNDTRRIVLLYYKLSNDRLCMRIFCTAFSGVQEFTNGRSEVVFFSWSQGEKQGQVEQQVGEIASCFLFSLSLLLSKTNAYFEGLRDLADELLSQELYILPFVTCDDAPSASAEVSLTKVSLNLRTFFGDVE